MNNQSTIKQNYLTATNGQNTSFLTPTSGNTTKSEYLNFLNPVSKTGVTNIKDTGIPNKSNTTNTTTSGAKLLFSDEQTAYDKMVNDGMTDEKARNIITQRRKQMLGTMSQAEGIALIKMQKQGIDSATAVEVVNAQRKKQQNEWKEENPIKNIGRQIYNAPVGAMSMATEQVGNVIDFATGGKTDIGQQVKEVQATNKYLEDSTGAKIGKGILGVGEMVATPGKIPGVSKIPVVGKALSGTVGELGTMGALYGGATPILEKGSEATTEDIKSSAVTGGLFGAGLGVAGKTAVGTAKFLTKKLPSKLQLSGLLNPAKLKKVEQTLQTEGQKTPENVAKWMMDRGIKGTKEQIITKLEQNANKSYNAVDDILKTIDDKVGKTFTNKQIDDALTQVIKDLDGVAGMETKLAEIQALLGKGKYTLTEANKSKRALDEMYNLYKQSGGETTGIKAEGLRNIRKSIREFIEEKAEKYGAKNIKALNNETAVGKALSDGISRKESADYVRELLSPFSGNLIGGAVGGGANIGPFQGDDMKSRIGNTIFGALIGKGLSSTYVKTNVSGLLNKFTKKELGALNEYITSGGAKTLGKDLEAKFTKETQLLLPEGRGANTIKTYITPSKSAIKTPTGTIGKAPTTPSGISTPNIQATKKDLNKIITPKKTKNANLNTPSNMTNNNISSNIQSIKTPTKKLEAKIKTPKSTKTTPKVIKKPTKIEKTKKVNDTSKITKGGENIQIKNNKIRAEGVTEKGTKIPKEFKGKEIDGSMGKYLENKGYSKIVNGPKTTYKKGDIFVKVTKRDGESFISVGKDVKLGENTYEVFHKYKDSLFNELEYLDNSISTTSKAIKTPTTILKTSKVIKTPTNTIPTTKTIQTNLNKLTKNNIDDIASKITTNKTKLAQVKQVIKDHIKKYGEDFKNYMSELVDKIADKVGARIKLLGGEGASKAPVSNLERAKNMASAGHNADDIWAKTGLEKGKDGKWRFEIDDSKAKIKIKSINKTDAYKGEKYSLNEILEHDKIFEQYPQLKGVKVNFKKGIDGKARTYKDPTDPAGFVIDINFNQLAPGNTEKLKSSLLHEIQHNIQEIEGFAKGGNANVGKTIAKELEYKISDLNTKMSKALKKDNKDLYYDLMDNRSDVVKELRNVQDEFGTSGYEGYKKLAGETEARNIQSRIKIPNKKTIRPAKTEDVARNKQIIIKDTGTSMLSDKGTGISGKKDLISEAKKYKSADEFMKAQGEPLYHGTKADFKTFDLSKAGTRNPKDLGFAGRGVYFTNSKKVAGDFIKEGGDMFLSTSQGGKGKVIDAYIDIKPNEILKVNDFAELDKALGLVQPKGMGGIEWGQKNADIIPKLAKEKGYKAIQVDGGGKVDGVDVYEIVIFDDKLIKTSDELKEIYKQANK